MTFVYIKSGQWVLAFHQAFHDPSVPMADWLSRFKTWGGGWDGFSADEIYLVHEAEKVMGKTYLAKDWSRNSGVPDLSRYARGSVVGVFNTEAAAIAFRDRFHAIGVMATKEIEAEAARLIKAYADKREAKALKEIHRLLPNHFGRVK